MKNFTCSTTERLHSDFYLTKAIEILDENFSDSNELVLSELASSS